MKIQKKYALSIIILFVVIIVVGGIFVSKSTISFKEAALEQVNLKEIDTIEIIKSEDNSANEKKITVSNAKEIHQIIEELSKVQLKNLIQALLRPACIGLLYDQNKKEALD